MVSRSIGLSKVHLKGFTRFFQALSIAVLGYDIDRRRPSPRFCLAPPRRSRRTITTRRARLSGDFIDQARPRRAFQCHLVIPPGPCAFASRAGRTPSLHDMLGRLSAPRISIKPGAHPNVPFQPQASASPRSSVPSAERIWRIAFRRSSGTPDNPARYELRSYLALELQIAVDPRSCPRSSADCR